MRTLRWTMLASHVPPGGGLGGIVRYTTELLRALGTRSDVEVTAVTTPDAVDTVRAVLGDRGRVVPVPRIPTPLLSIGERWLPGFGGPRDSDVVHGMKHLVPHRSTAMKVLTVHDMLLVDRPSDFGRDKRLLLPPVYRGSIRDADLILCVSAATRARLASHVPAAVDRSEVVHLATSSTLRASDAAPLPALSGRPFALVVGDPTPRKNLRTVLAAWPEVRRRVPDAVLAVAGPPSWGRTDVGPTWDALVAQGAVAPLGHVTDAQLRWAYERATTVLCPSLAEGFGLPAAEALNLGAPVVISDDAALQEVCRGRARAVLPATAIDRWSDAIVSSFSSRPASPDPGVARTWDDVADETVAAVRRSLARTR